MTEQHATDLSSVWANSDPTAHRLPEAPVSPHQFSLLAQPPCTPIERQTLGALMVKEVDSPYRISESTAYVGLGYKLRETPIDIISLLLPAASTRELCVLVVDEFQRINRVPESDVIAGAEHLSRTVEAIGGLFRLTSLRILLASEEMRSESYPQTRRDIEERISLYPDQEKIKALLAATIPPSKRGTASFEYAISEIAISDHLRRSYGVQVKLGPDREKLYDQIMKELEIPLGFAYAVDALPTGSLKVEPVVHYISTHRGRSRDANRILLEDSESEIRMKLEGSSPQAIAAMERILLVANALRGAGTPPGHAPLARRLCSDLLHPISRERERLFEITGNITQ